MASHSTPGRTNLYSTFYKWTNPASASGCLSNMHLRGGRGSISGDALVTSVDTTPGTFRCHRGRLEQFLRENQDIRWEHTIKDIETTPQKVIVRIQNEQAIESDVLIGTDGVHSQVRKSLAPGIQLKVLPFVVFNGKRKMSLDSFQNTMAPQMQGLSIIQCRKKSGVSDRRESIHCNELKDLGQAYKEMFDVTKVRQDRILHFLMRSTLGTEQEIKDLTDQGVLLVGDAVHAMPLLGGEGGNNAIKDGVDLAEHIAAHGPQGIKTFSSARYDSWRKGVEESERRLAEMHTPVKASFAQKTVLTPMPLCKQLGRPCSLSGYQQEPHAEGERHKRFLVGRFPTIETWIVALAELHEALKADEQEQKQEYLEID
ncbi:hypothetical protein HO173_000468 [Letharia columbiana]|uniref:FAD-binding domain-containing protein n=1 Tax=Letharia columbiana TaxID=112416 RepID=A0A8H6G743_9LECA|nr:uncharacterized protein HO173_000468 [Letharia columbiana]KAF6241756.1 hypothetical protein HO173_000468 [Letharia columbiana]